MIIYHLLHNHFKSNDTTKSLRRQTIENSAVFRRLLIMTNTVFRTLPILSLPNDVLSFEGERFFDLIQQTCGNAFKELMGILSINTVRKLLLIENDVLSVFQKNYRELQSVIHQACLHLDDGTILLKPGLRMDFDQLIASLHAQIDQEFRSEQTIDSIESVLSSLKRMIKSGQFEDNNDDSKDDHAFLFAFVENIFRNLLRNRNNYRHSEAIENFAQSLYIMGGRNTYEFVRLNLPGSLPTLSTLNENLTKAGAKIEECQFRYDKLEHHRKMFGHQIAVCSEDSTAVIKKVSYDSSTNTFTGFSTPIRDGIPKVGHFRTDSFDQLNNWFENEDKASLINVHMVQPLSASENHVSPFLLSVFGTNNNFTAIDVLRRWMWIYESSLKSNVRVVAFSTDCDARYLLAMRLATGFFANVVDNISSDQTDMLEIDLPGEWTQWFFMKTRQTFFCVQDPIHLCTKLRNRILSKKASLLIGNEVVSTDVLMKLIESKSKLVHGLVKTDVEPKDRQNFRSCMKLSNEDVLVALEDIEDSLATRVYLRILRSIVVAYIEDDTTIVDRLYHGWFTVFLCRLWRTWLEHVEEDDIPTRFSEKKKDDLFITIPAHFSIELNAHTLLSICLLVRQKSLPLEALSMSNYSSQPCESLFRLARSMSGTFSSVVNFTTDQFLQRTAKLSVLSDLENRSQSCQLEHPLKYPKHHKRRQSETVRERETSTMGMNDLTDVLIKKTVNAAYKDAYKLLSELEVDIVLKKRKINSIRHVNSFIRSYFEKKFKRISLDDNRTDESDDEYYDSTDPNAKYTSEADQDDVDDEIDNSHSLSANGQSDFRGMRIVDDVSSSLRSSYFQVNIDNQVKYIHKQTACWLLTDSKADLSADRLKRVQQANH